MIDLTFLVGSLPNVLNILLALGGLSVSLRAFFLYRHLRSPRLFILGVVMGIIACTAAADFTSGLVTTLNTDWFLFLGQGISFGFLFLSLLRISDLSLRRLILWQMISASLLFFLLILAPILPAFPNIATTVILSGSRAAGCLLIFGYYATVFSSKGTRFSLLMGIAFALLSIGYFLLLLKYIIILPEGGIVDQLADGLRIFGILVLLIGYVKG